MKLVDTVYGEQEVAEPLLLELITSPGVQRLKGIQQYGLPPKYYHNHSFSRYEHSVGVMLLLRHFGADLAEQTAGLLHDISHTAFSHLTDAVLGTAPDSNVQDARHMAFLVSSEVAGILVRHGFDPKHIADLDRFTLLERDAPELCADRVDYALREFVACSKNSMVESYLAALLTYQGRLVFATRDAAESFGVNYLYSMSKEWAGVEKTVRQHLFADALSTALMHNIITVEDLFEHDAHVLAKIENTRQPKVRAILKLLSKEFVLEKTDRTPDFDLPRHFRYVDPEFMQAGKAFRLSKRVPSFRRLVKSEMTKHAAGVKVRMVNNVALMKKVRGS